MSIDSRPETTVSIPAQVPPDAPLGVPFGAIDVSGYTPTDNWFGSPYIDRDEWRELPHPHRNVHGGFSGTDTRFTMYFPTTSEYDGRLYAPIEGAHGGNDGAFGGPMGEMLGGVKLTARLGGYMLDTNQGHIGDDVDPRAGDDNTLYGFRATNESARFSKFVAAQVYGEAPHHAYVWGGSGGGRRSPGCLENGPDVWDGALPFMGGGNIVDPGVHTRVKGSQVMSFGSMFNVQRVLKDKIAQVTDAMAAGGSGNPFAGLSTHQAEELATLYRLGYPRGDEFMIGQPMGQIWLWSSMADDLQKQDPDYFEAFWTKPGYVGHDAPELLAEDLIDTEGVVERVITPRDFLEHPEQFEHPDFELMKLTVTMMAGHLGLDFPLAVEIRGIEGYRIGCGIRVTSGEAAGRQLYTLKAVQDVFQCDGVAEANTKRFTGVQPGDTVHVDNRAFLAFCYYHRHHLMDDRQFDFLRVDGVPIYPQHPVPDQSPLMGVPYTGAYEGKLLWIHHSHDASLWPAQGVLYSEAVLRNRGQQALEEDFCLRWSENAEHVPPFVLPSDPRRASSTWLIDYMPLIEQGLLDLQTWCEQGVKPAGTAYTFEDGKVTLPATAAERGGVQPVVSVTADGGVRAEVPAGSTVTLAVTAEVPPGGGGITGVEWDFEGEGTFEFDHEGLDGTQPRVELTTTRTYPTPGTYWATARVVSHVDGEVGAVARNLPNVASARIVVS
ncbi:MAG: hypothetical protein JWM64_1154 [Frankiales bacterium]|nr:hypothetical protein [Frankiales bacterium]